MKEEVREFVFYLWLIIKKLYLWLAIIYTVLGLANWTRFLKFDVPALLFWLVGFIGLLWAGFRIYKEQLKSVPLGQELIKVKRNPKILIDLVKGNEFSFHLDPIGAGNVLGNPPQGNIVLHVKVSNNGYLDAAMLGIRGNFRSHDLWYAPYQTRVFNKENIEVKFPFTLHPQGKWLGDLYFRVMPSPLLNDAQIKDRLSKHQMKGKNLKFWLELEFQDTLKATRTIEYEREISSELLVEMFIQRLQELGKY